MSQLSQPQTSPNVQPRSIRHLPEEHPCVPHRHRDAPQGALLQKLSAHSGDERWPYPGGVGLQGGICLISSKAV